MDREKQGVESYSEITTKMQDDMYKKNAELVAYLNKIPDIPWYIQITMLMEKFIITYEEAKYLVDNHFRDQMKHLTSAILALNKELAKD